MGETGKDLLQSKGEGVEDTRYQLSQGVYLVDGAKRSALYDTNTGNIYSLNSEAASTITSQEYDKAFWQILISEGLVTSGFEAASRDSKTLRLLNRVSKLNFAWLEVTEDCNERCIHCYGSFSSLCKKRSYSPLSDKQWRITLDALRRQECDQVQFIGGEPFLYRGNDSTNDVLNLAFWAKNLGFSFIEIFSNCTLLSEQQISLIKEGGFSIATSLYSSNEDIHDAITQVRGSCEKTKINLLKLKAAGVNVRVAIIVMKQNEETVEDTISKLEEWGVGVAQTDIVRLSGRAESSGVVPSAGVFKKYGLMCEPNFCTSLESFQNNINFNPCLNGKVAITAYGDVLPCIFSRKQVVGNIQNEDLESILTSEYLQKIWHTTKDSVDVCRDCEYRYACSDCRPLSYLHAGNNNFLGAPYPRCSYNPYEGIWGNGVWQIQENGLNYVNL